MINRSWIRIPGRALDHNSSGAPKTNQSQDLLRIKPNSGFLTAYGDFKRV